MYKLENLEPSGVFRYFEELTRIPRGSGNMEKVSEYCMEFAKAHHLEAIRDAANNVIIFKKGSAGFENAKPVILQGHLDMVCQKEEDRDIDFEKDGLDIYIDGDYIKARGTTLGADNGIAVAMMLSILERDDIAHPPIEAIFTTDEEVGMIGATRLSLGRIRGKRMINIDSEDASVVTVSCAGGSDFRMNLPITRTKKSGKCICLAVKGLKGGHSGVEINSGRVNANILMGRILNNLKNKCDFDIISIDGGEKGNAIPVSCVTKIVVKDSGLALTELLAYGDVIKKEIALRESAFSLEIDECGAGDFDVIDARANERIIYALLCAPNGVVSMSAEIENLVETSLNLGILKTHEDSFLLLFALRSNKQSALEALEARLVAFARQLECDIETGGHYPPWEYNDRSQLRELYISKYREKFGQAPSVEAIHAGLECGVFAAQIADFDCISIGPEMHDIHTPKERLSISSTKDIYGIILGVLAECK